VLINGHGRKGSELAKADVFFSMFAGNSLPDGSVSSAREISNIARATHLYSDSILASKNDYQPNAQLLLSGRTLWRTKGISARSLDIKTSQQLRSN
jgi:hypothetical protein